MSEEQQNSYRLLFDWWVGAYDHPTDPIFYLKECIRYLATLKRETGEPIDKKLMELWSGISKHRRVLVGENLERMKVNKVSINAYPTAMWSLFVAEFVHPLAYDVGDRDDNPILKWRRRDAAATSYRQLVGMESLRQIIPDPFPPTLRPRDKDDLLDGVCSFEASDPVSPRRIEGGPLLQACPWLPPMDYVKYADSEDEDDAYDNQDDREYEPLRGWPEYLWDIKNRRVVRTRTFRYDLPEYTVISHTWGRGALPGQGYIVPDGLKYPIPHNSTFDVTTLPATLETLQGRIRPSYVWLDLVCIPQGKEGELDEEDQHLRLSEIARQGTIFRNATSSIAWLHDVQDLSSLAALFEWLCMPTLKPGNCSDHEEQLSEFKDQLLARIKRWPPGLLLGPNGQKVNPWFDSLWTLQELCLKPNMLIATSTLEIMSTKAGSPIPLNGLLCAHNQYQGPEQPEEGVSRAIKELSDFAEFTGLKKLLDLTQLDILELAFHRYCGGRREEAIMSALGATSWFEEVRLGWTDLYSNNASQSHPRFVKEAHGLLTKDFFITPITGQDESRTECHGASSEMLEIESGKSIQVYHYLASSMQGALVKLLGVEE